MSGAYCNPRQAHASLCAMSKPTRNTFVTLGPAGEEIRQAAADCGETLSGYLRRAAELRMILAASGLPDTPAGVMQAIRIGGIK